jgi:hypothetical protein
MACRCNYLIRKLWDMRVDSSRIRKAIADLWLPLYVGDDSPRLGGKERWKEKQVCAPKVTVVSSDIEKQIPPA